jgi:hypothetical protein
MLNSLRLVSRHPFDFMPPGWWPRFFWPLFGVMVLLMVVFWLTGTSLTTDAAPYGIVSFELAGSVENAAAILGSWDADAKIRAAFSLGFDFLFMAAYASTIAFGCGMASRVLQQSGWPFAGWGNLLAWGVIFAAILDGIENIALIVLLFGTVISPWPEIAAGCAVIKFVWVFIGIVYIIYGGVIHLVERVALPEQE